MDKKSKIFFSVFFSIAFIVMAVAFFKFYVFKDYYIKSEAECDPETENCFIYECDPAEDSECPENPDERASYYKLVEKKAYALPVCDSADLECSPIACQEGEDCTEILCDEASKAEDEQCNDPEEYIKNQEETKGNDECDADDENCIIDEDANLGEENAQENITEENQIQDNSEAGD